MSRESGHCTAGGGNQKGGDWRHDIDAHYLSNCIIWGEIQAHMRSKNERKQDNNMTAINHWPTTHSDVKRIRIGMNTLSPSTTRITLSNNVKWLLEWAVASKHHKVAKSIISTTTWKTGSVCGREAQSGKRRSVGSTYVGGTLLFLCFPVLKTKTRTNRSFDQTLFRRSPQPPNQGSARVL